MKHRDYQALAVRLVIQQVEQGIKDSHYIVHKIVLDEYPVLTADDCDKLKAIAHQYLNMWNK